MEEEEAGLDEAAVEDKAGNVPARYLQHVGAYLKLEDDPVWRTSAVRPASCADPVTGDGDEDADEPDIFSGALRWPAPGSD